jgi:hypothetical protein
VLYSVAVGKAPTESQEMFGKRRFAAEIAARKYGGPVPNPNVATVYGIGTFELFPWAGVGVSFDYLRIWNLSGL